jgi:hypothetical protein
MKHPLGYAPELPPVLQTADWTCSACSLAWLNRALGIHHATEEWSAVEYIGQPDNINSLYGLMDGSGARLAQCLREQGAPTISAWPTFQQVLEFMLYGPALLGGAGWYHWVVAKFNDNGTLALANSAPGWWGIDQSMTEAAFLQTGPHAAVAVPLLNNIFPSPAA